MSLNEKNDATLYAISKF